MKFKIHFEWPNGDDDSVIVESDTLEGIRKQAREELDKREAEYRWSEEIKSE